MIDQPFALFRPFERELRITLFTKVDDVRSDLDAARRMGFRDAAGLEQEHAARVLRVDRTLPRTEKGDGMATDKPTLALCIRAADCQSFVVYAPSKRVAGVLHVGWRCIEAGTIGALYALLEQEWGITPQETLVGGGPSLGFECAEFTDPARELPSVSPALVKGKLVNLAKAAEEQFLALGVRPECMERMSDCTKCHPETYWTYRGGDRDAVKAGHTNMLCCVLL